MKACSLTATDEDGDEATLMFTLSVMVDPMPTFGDTTVAAQVYMKHREIGIAWRKGRYFGPAIRHLLEAIFVAYQGLEA